MWPGLVGKGGPGAEPPIDLDTMLDLTAAAEVDGVEFDGVDLFLFDPHVNIDSTDDDLKRLADKVRAQGPRGRLARRAGLAADRRRLGDGQRRGSQAVPRRRCARPAASRKKLRELGVRPYGVVRIDSACEPGRLGRRIPKATRRRSPRRSAQACDVAEDYGERLAAEGEICWGGMHSWKRDGRAAGSWSTGPKTLGFQADMAHTLLFTLGYNAPEDRILPEDFDWNDTAALDDALTEDDRTRCGPGRSTSTSRRTTRRSTAPARTTRPAATACRTIPNGKLDIAAPRRLLAARRRRQARRKAFQHICWDGCMFPNDDDDEAARPGTTSCGAMIAVRDAHGWRRITQRRSTLRAK